MKDLILELATIPHLELNLDFDNERMIDEYLAVGDDRLHQYNTKFKMVDHIYRRSWHGISLLSPDGSLYNDVREGDAITDSMDGHYLETEIAPICPYMMEVVEKLGGGNARARIMQIMPEGQLAWHSHVIDNGQPLYALTVHVPIVTPPNFRFSVISAEDYRTADIEHNPLHVYSKCYPVGRATVFNSIHYHNVFNNSVEQIRTSLMVYLDLRRPRVQELVRDAINSYTGDRIRLSNVDGMIKILGL